MPGSLDGRIKFVSNKTWSVQSLEVEVMCEITALVVCSSGIVSLDRNRNNTSCLFVASKHMQHNYFIFSPVRMCI
jgi:hypothetical protein